MFRKIALALIATSILVAPALAKDTAKTMPAKPVATQVTPNDAAKPAVKPVATVKVGKRHRHFARHHRHHRHHMFAGKHRHHVAAGKHRTHVRHIVTTKPGMTPKFTKAPVHKTHLHRTVKVKKPIKTHRTAALKPAPRMGKVVKRGA
jgi:hypothetical protein